jgi:hypothetical protein
MSFATVQEITNEVTGVQMRVERNNETRTGGLLSPGEFEKRIRHVFPPVEADKLIKRVLLESVVPIGEEDVILTEEQIQTLGLRRTA